MKKGSRLFSYAGAKVVVDSVFSFRTDTATTVYNLEVKGNENYYVSASKVLVHNCKKTLAKFSGILRDAAKGKGNFGLGEATYEEAMELGKAWVGKGYTISKNGKILNSKSGLRQFRVPSNKPRINKIQANFEWRLKTKGEWQGNGHLDIIK